MATNVQHATFARHARCTTEVHPARVQLTAFLADGRLDKSKLHLF